MNIKEELLNPRNISCSLCQSPVFSFGGRLSHGMLFLSTPRDQIGAQEQTETSGRTPIDIIPSPIGITKSCDVQRTRICLKNLECVVGWRNLTHGCLSFGSAFC
ncbi:uncharacterized protein LOC131307440 [Rhododendron vialii]|uniref:uncharacterized protein LOC131307440 n=1 Tax=Rhododendron vialii TaxID=182163 RepID=UPI00265FA10F|nr:uncharacterized protein LOC131307440 [Rhododendron vialii]